MKYSSKRIKAFLELLAAVPIFFLLSCSLSGSKPLDFSLKNSSSGVLTVSLGDESSIRVIQGFCFKFSKEDFPLTVVFGNYESSLFLSQPAHYVIEDSKKARKELNPCQPAQIE